MLSNDLLFEIGTEELPPKTLKKIAESFQNEVSIGLKKHDISFSNIKWFATPRRIALIINSLAVAQSDQLIKKVGPLFDQNNDSAKSPSQAVLGFARSCGVAFDELTLTDSPKGKKYYYETLKKGQQTKDLLENIFNTALKKLPIAKTMRWGDSPIEFVRPIHWILLIFGQSIIDVKIMGKASNRITYGHRFHAPEPIEMSKPSEYKTKMLEDGMVLVDWKERQDIIMSQISKLADEIDTEPFLDKSLVDEVTAIVEYPCAILCKFDSRFLEIPQEALISAMHEHQKCFPLIDKNNKLVNNFITVSNILSTNPQSVIDGNEKVMAARLSDADFFYNTDTKNNLEYYLKYLQSVTFQKELGSMLDKTMRTANLSKQIAEIIGADLENAHRGGKLSKADLMTNMVFEFTDLQGIIGKYYAIKCGENTEVANAIEQQYWPIGQDGLLPTSKVSACVSLADKMDTLYGIFSIGKKPTGDKDPFALRRCAIGILRILKELKLNISLDDLILGSRISYAFPPNKDLDNQVNEFLLERLRFIYKSENISSNVFEAVLNSKFKNIADFDARIKATTYFTTTSNADNLIQANKRVKNILIKNNVNEKLTIDKSLFANNFEEDIYSSMQDSEPKIEKFILIDDYSMALLELSNMNEVIANFFDNVMIMDENKDIRNNRLAILQRLNSLFMLIADISKLQ